MTIIRHYAMRAGDGQADALLTALHELARVVGSLEGCEGIDLLRDQDDPARFVFLERWTTADAHKAAAGKLPRELIGAVLAPLADPLEGRYLAPA